MRPSLWYRSAVEGVSSLGCDTGVTSRSSGAGNGAGSFIDGVEGRTPVRLIKNNYKSNSINCRASIG